MGSRVDFIAGRGGHEYIDDVWVCENRKLTCASFERHQLKEERERAKLAAEEASKELAEREKAASEKLREAVERAEKEKADIQRLAADEKRRAEDDLRSAREDAERVLQEAKREADAKVRFGRAADASLDGFMMG